MTKRVMAAVAVEPTSVLDELLEAEREIARRLAETVVECQSLADAARVEAAAIERAATLALDAELARLRDEAAQERETGACEINDGVARAIARYDHLADEEVERLAEFIAGRVTGLPAVSRGVAP